MFSPAMRLAHTFVCVSTGLHEDIESWTSWCREMAHSGVGMIAVQDDTWDRTFADQILSAARAAHPNGLIAACEPVDRKVSTDVAHLSASRNVKRWVNRLTGCQIDTHAQATRALKAGCDYLVIDASNEDLLRSMADLSTENPALVWFVSGCTKFRELTRATDLGATRVWMSGESSGKVEKWANHCRKLATPSPLSIKQL